MKKKLVFIVCIGSILLTNAADVTIATSGNTWGANANPTVNVGDRIIFQFNGFHNSTSGTIPLGAISWASGNMSSGTFSVVLTVTGTYTYSCTLHGGMNGTITVNPAAPTISTGSISTLTICGGNALSIPFTFTGSVSGFSAELSDENGSFLAPISLNTVSVTANSLIVTIPANATSGNSYRIRVIGATPSVTGSDNGSNIHINLAEITPSFNIQTSPQGAICPGTTVSFSGTALNANIPSYKWYINTSLLGANSPQFSYFNFQNGDRGYVIVSASTTGCNPVIYTNTIVGDVMTVSSAVTPSLTLNIPSSFVCRGEVVTVNGTPSGGGSEAEYMLYMNGNTILGGNSALGKISNLTVGIYTFSGTMRSSLSCATVQTVSSNSVVVEVRALPETPIVNEISTLIGCPPENPCCNTVALTISSSSSADYEWFSTTSGMVLSTTTGYTPTISGTYFVKAIANGCSSTSANFSYSKCENNNTTLTSSIVTETASLIKIYPNPVTEKLLVATEQGVKKSELQIRIYTIDYQLVKSQTFTEGVCKGGKGKDCLCPGLSEIDVHDLVSGMYVVQILSGNEVAFTRKLVVQ
jgi:hypothetical protein